ncbi:MAG: hypothetical protein R3F19_19520 [Verrucomicrobiales bacterium]
MTQQSPSQNPRPSIETLFAHLAGQPRSCSALEYGTLGTLVRAMAPCGVFGFDLGTYQIRIGL